MNPISYIIAAIVLIGFAAAVIGVIKSGHGSCGSCSGCMYKDGCSKAKNR